METVEVTKSCRNELKEIIKMTKDTLNTNKKKKKKKNTKDPYRQKLLSIMRNHESQKGFILLFRYYIQSLSKHSPSQKPTYFYVYEKL
jgi:hypothetical protein